MVRLHVALRGSAHSAQDLLEACRFLMVGTRLDQGCAGCWAWTDPDGMVHYVEEWTTDADMRRRIRSRRFKSVLAILESVHEPPRVQFDFVTATRGLDYVNEIRYDAGN
jgi:quinol monooxygenase YgiN